ncbi:hypothetical protein [Lamprobacter modestohalophilus]|uniref:hypothetical protein n=1 Tax=Lamprobacter modestohalophilus TaxID=1064514 RepID=UPI001A9121C3|nr:hypothetical protein [Lamprobacter modestohalophilus]
MILADPRGLEMTTMLDRARANLMDLGKCAQQRHTPVNLSTQPPIVTQCLTEEWEAMRCLKSVAIRVARSVQIEVIGRPIAMTFMSQNGQGVSVQALGERLNSGLQNGMLDPRQKAERGGLMGRYRSSALCLSSEHTCSKGVG